MKVIVIESGDGGFIVHHRAKDAMPAVSFHGPWALRRALAYAGSYFKDPTEASESPSFAAVPAIKVEGGALEPKNTHEVKTEMMTRSQIEAVIKESEKPMEPPEVHDWSD